MIDPSTYKFVNENPYFPIELQKIHIEGVNTDTFRGVVRRDTQQTLAVVSAGYNLLRNETLFPLFEETIAKSLDVEGMEIHTSLSPGGGRTVREYVLPNHAISVDKRNRKIGDTINMSLKVVNSYDGSSSLSVGLHGHRLACLNGMVFANTVADHKRRHTSGTLVETLMNSLDGVAEDFAEQAAQWQKWVNIKLDGEEHAQALIETMSGMNPSLAERLTDRYIRAAQADGDTLWTLFNVLTAWSTHEEVAERSEGNKPSIILNREQRVRGVLSQPAWAALEKAA